MKLAFVSDSLGGHSFREMLNHARRLGLSGVEVNACGWTAAPHFDLQEMLASPDARKAYRREFDARGLEIICFNANGNPLHPADPSRAQGFKDAIRVAGEMGIATVCAMSGLPAGSASDTMPNGVVSSWPRETQAILKHQWDEKLALELHGNQCVYNLPSLMRLREAVGPSAGANLDPSHLFWMGADPFAAADALGDAIRHVHAKDTLLNAPVQATTSLLENGGLADISARSWSCVTLGFGHGEDWWRQLCFRLGMVGYDGWLSIEHEDLMLGSLECLEKSVNLLRGAMPVAASDYAPPEICESHQHEFA